MLGQGSASLDAGFQVFFVYIDIGVSKNRGTGVFTMENPIKMDDLGVPLFLETPNMAEKPEKNYSLNFLN